MLYMKEILANFSLIIDGRYVKYVLKLHLYTGKKIQIEDEMSI